MEKMVREFVTAEKVDRKLLFLKKEMAKTVCRLFSDKITDEQRDSLTERATFIEEKLVEKIGFDAAELYIDSLFDSRLYA